MTLLRSANQDVHKDKNREHASKLEPIEVVLVHCNLVNNSYKQTREVLFTSVLNNFDN